MIVDKRTVPFGWVVRERSVNSLGEVESVPSTDAFASITFPWFSTLLSTGITEVSCVGLDGTFGVTLMSKERGTNNRNRINSNLEKCSFLCGQISFCEQIDYVRINDCVKSLQSYPNCYPMSAEPQTLVTVSK